MVVEMKLSLRIAVLTPIVGATLLAQPSLAHTYVVDSHGGAGVDFTDLPPAVAAAQPGDVLLVMSGVYHTFTCNRGLAILGYGNPYVVGTATFSTIPQGQTAAMTGITLNGLVVTTCDGRVVVQQASVIDDISIGSSADVRLLDATVNSPPSGHPGLDVSSSRVEVVQSSFRGGYEPYLGSCTQPGSPGLQVQASGRVHFARSNGFGGDGPYFCSDPNNFGSAPGGPGISATDSEVIVAGGGTPSLIDGGTGGTNDLYAGCFNAASGGPGILAANALVSYSGSRVLGGETCISPSGNNSNCYCHREAPFSGSTIVPVSPVDSTLTLTGVPTPGQTVSLTLSGEPGSDAWLWFGRHLVLIQQSGVEIELGVAQDRFMHLGAMPPAGSITVQFPVPSTYPAGTLLGVQGECRFGSGTIRRSNSIPIVVR
jgi:hypothetical protein